MCTRVSAAGREAKGQQPGEVLVGEFRVSKSGEGVYYWNLRAGGGQRLLQSEVFALQGHAIGAVDACREHCLIAERYVRRQTNGGQQYFTLHDAAGGLLGVSQMHGSAQAREVAIAGCKLHGPTASVVDQTGDRPGYRAAA